MKKADIAMIILIASVSVLISYFVVGAIPAFKNANQAVKVKTIDKYEATIQDPDKTVFSNDAINPTVQVTIGESGQDSNGTPNN